MQYNRRRLFAFIVGAFGSLICGSNAMSLPLTGASLGPETTPFPPTFGLLTSRDEASAGACSSTDCLVVWTASNGDGGDTRWWISFVALDGKPSNSRPTALTTAEPGSMAPIVATDGVTYVLAWRTSAGLVYRQIDAKGKWLQPAAIAVPETASPDLMYRLTWTGTQFLLITRTTKLTVTSLFSAADKPRLGPTLFREEFHDLAWFSGALWILTRAPSLDGAPAGRLFLHKLTLGDGSVSEAPGSPTVLAGMFERAVFVSTPAGSPQNLTAVHTKWSPQPAQWRLMAHKIGTQGVLPTAAGDVLVSSTTRHSFSQMAVSGSVVLFGTGQNVRRFDLNTGWVDGMDHVVASGDDSISLFLNSPAGFVALASPPNAASLSRDVCVGVVGLSGPVEPLSCKNVLSVAYVDQLYLQSAEAPGTALVAFQDAFADGFQLGTLGQNLEGMVAPWGAKDTRYKLVDVSHGKSGFRVLWQETSSVVPGDRLKLAIVPNVGPPTLQTASELEAPAEAIGMAWHDDRGLILFQPVGGSAWPQTVVYGDNGAALGAPVTVPPLAGTSLETSLRGSVLGANADAFLVTWAAYADIGKLECRLVLDRYDRQGAFFTRAILPPEQSDCAGDSGRRVFAQSDASFLVAFATPKRDRLVNLVRVTSDGVATPLGSVLAGVSPSNASHAFAAFDENKVVFLQSDGSSTLSGGVVTAAANALSVEPFAFALPHVIAKPALTAWSKTRLLLTYQSFDAQFGVTTVKARFVAVGGTMLTAEPGGDAGAAADAADAGPPPQSESDAGPEGGQPAANQDPRTASDGGCGCSVGGVTKQGAWPALLLLAWLVAVRRRNRTEDR